MYVRLSSFPSYIPLYSYAATLHYKKIQSFKIQRVGVCGVCVCSGDLELKKKKITGSVLFVRVLCASSVRVGVCGVCVFFGAGRTGCGG